MNLLANKRHAVGRCYAAPVMRVLCGCAVKHYFYFEKVNSNVEFQFCSPSR
jgi:hypothetical protein